MFITDATGRRLADSLDRTASAFEALLARNGNGKGNGGAPPTVASGFDDNDDPHRFLPRPPATERWLLTEDVARICNCHVQTVRRWCRQRKGPGVRRDSDGPYARFWVAHWLADEWKTRIDKLRGSTPPFEDDNPTEDPPQEPNEEQDRAPEKGEERGHDTHQHHP
jgi:hypothetical protein